MIDAAARLAPDVIGHEDVRTAFTHALEGKRVAHAYLLVGPEGVGKKTFAEGIAAAYLCGRAAGALACGECSSCRTLRSGNHPGFSRLEPTDGARVVDIGQVRATTEAFAVRTGDRRVMVVDPADTLPPASASAFLKTLEEPPAGIVFLLVTSRPAQLLDTIVSRCHRVGFGGLSRDEFGRVLDRLDVPLEEHDRLFAMSAGAPGLAVKLRDGIAACGGEDAFDALLEGEGTSRPEALIELVPPLRSDEPKRERVRRLLELVLDGIRARRSNDPDQRTRQAERSLAIAKLHDAIESNLNAELVLERLAGYLRSR